MIKLWHVQMKQDISNDTVYKVDVYHLFHVPAQETLAKFKPFWLSALSITHLNATFHIDSEKP